MTGRFVGQAALVTGAARGIGAATALRLAAEGASVLAVDRLAADLAALPGQAAGGGEIRTLEQDVAAADAPARITAAALEGFGRLDILVNNAGVGGSANVERTSDADLDRFLDINLRSVFRLCREALAYLPRPGGRIVNISSVFGLVGFPGSSGYGIAKAGVAQLTRQMATDYAPHGLRINAVAPGIIRTPMTQGRIDDDWYRRAMIDTTPVPRLGRPEDIAGVVAFLCSEDAAFVCGEVIAVDGGWLATRHLPA